MPDPKMTTRGRRNAIPPELRKTTRAEQKAAKAARDEGKKVEKSKADAVVEEKEAKRRIAQRRVAAYEDKQHLEDQSIRS